MVTEEFFNEFIPLLELNSIHERTKDSCFDETTYYTQTYSAINEIYSGMLYDVEGGQLWITIPFKDEKLKDFLFQINLRTFDVLHFRCNPDMLINSICGRLLFLYKWRGVYNCIFDDEYDYLPEIEHKVTAKRLINNNLGMCKTYKHYQLYTDQIFDLISSTISSLQYIVEKEDVVKELKECKTYTQVKKVFIKTIKPFLKDLIGEKFKIK